MESREATGWRGERERSDKKRGSKVQGREHGEKKGVGKVKWRKGAEWKGGT